MQSTQNFWNASPCGAQEHFVNRAHHRYGIEPWVLDVFKKIVATGPENILEIGCGQGTDGYTLCQMLPGNSRYLGIDYSDESLAVALRSRSEVENLAVEPVFKIGDAEHLDLDENSVSCVYSNGVLHHTSDPARAFDEVFRVLKPGGQAFITLYRKPSLKVGIAQALRKIQAGVDKIFGTNRFFYRLLYGRHLPKIFGTMFLECFGVPYMAWYTKSELLRCFNRFSILELKPVGYNLLRRKRKGNGWVGRGYMWFVHLKKPTSLSTAFDPNQKDPSNYDPRYYVEDDVLAADGLVGFLARKRKDAIVRLVNGALEKNPSSRLLDVGCGYGEILRNTKAAFRFGLDTNQQALDRAKDLSGVNGPTFVLGEVDEIPFSSGYFDAVICSEVLEHVEDPSALITELTRVVKPGGYICISVPNEWVTTIGRALTGKKPWKSPAHKWAFTPRKITKLFPMERLHIEFVPFRWLPFALSTNLVALFQRPK